MTTKPLLISVSLAIIALIAVALALLPSFKAVTREQFELVKAGMTQAETEHLLFGPPRNELIYPSIVWLPQAAGKPISAEIAPGAPAVDFFSQEVKPKNGPRGVRITNALDFFPREMPKNGYQAVWITKAGLIAVYFGQDGRVQEKYTSMVYEPVRPSMLSWLASRPTMIRQSLGFR